MKVKQKLFVILCVVPMVMQAADDEGFSSVEVSPEREVVIQVIKNGSRNKSLIMRDGCKNEVSCVLYGCKDVQSGEHDLLMTIDSISPPNKQNTGQERWVRWRVPCGMMPEDFSDQERDEQLCRSWLRTNHSISYFHHNNEELLVSQRKRGAWHAKNKPICSLRGLSSLFLLLEVHSDGRFNACMVDDDALKGAVRIKEMAGSPTSSTPAMSIAHMPPEKQFQSQHSVSYPGALGSPSWVQGQHPINQGAMASSQRGQYGRHFSGASGSLPLGIPVPTDQAPPPPYSPEAKHKDVPVYPAFHEQEKK